MVNTTIFYSLNKCMGEMSLRGVLENIQQGVYREEIERYRATRAAGDTARAERMKKRLPAFTPSATYRGRRKAECMESYHPLVILDADHLDLERLARVIPLVREAPYTVASFVSPGGEGLKIIAYAPTDTAPDPARHRPLYQAVERWYADLTGIAFDTSGSDPGRLCFVSHDPALYLNPAYGGWLLGIAPPPRVEPFAVEPPAKEGGKGKRPGRKRGGKLLQEARRRAERQGPYAEGDRNNFLYRMAAQANRLGAAREELEAYAAEHFDDLADDERAATIGSAYANTGEHASEPFAGKGGSRRQSLDIEAIFRHIAERFVLRHNRVRGHVEAKRLGEPDNAFAAINDIWHNSLWCDLQQAGLPCHLRDVESAVLSDFTPSYHPFRDYFEGLPEWDGRDYIGELAETVTTDRPEYWRHCLRKWLVATVACAIDDKVENHTMLLLAGPQGIGKTSWLRRLVPPELTGYTYSGLVDPSQKDSQLLLTDCFLVILDELSGQTAPELNRLKAMITQDVVKLRRPYARFAEVWPRHASFAATVNDGQVLNDPSGSRRFLCFEATRIDYMRPVNHAGVYAQALALYRRGEKYWFSDDDLPELSRNNERFQQVNPVEELFYTYFRKPLPGEPTKLMSSSDILARICALSRLQMTQANVNFLGKMLKKHGFLTKRRSNNRLFEVYELSFDEIKLNSFQKEENSSYSDNQCNTENPQLPF